VILLAADEDFDNRVVRGVLRREPDVNLLRVQDAGLSGPVIRRSLSGRRGKGGFSSLTTRTQ
jgi:hypothetical protein